MGLIAATELVANKGTKASFPVSDGVAAAHAGQRALAHGVITLALGDNVNGRLRCLKQRADSRSRQQRMRTS